MFGTVTLAMVGRINCGDNLRSDHRSPGVRNKVISSVVAVGREKSQDPLILVGTQGISVGAAIN